MKFSCDIKGYELGRNAVIDADTAEEKFERKQYLKKELEKLLHASQKFGGICGCAEDAEFYKACWLPDKRWEEWLIEWCTKFRQAQTEWREYASIRKLRQER